MPRTTSLLVGGIIEVDSSITVDPFIDVANELVTECCTGDNGPDTEYTETRLELIERWLAAHFYAIRDMRPDNEKAGSVAEKYQYKVDLYLANTMYGQQALILDTNGGLAALNQATENGSPRKIVIAWLGAEEGELA